MPHDYHRYETWGTGTGERGCVVLIFHNPHTNDITLQVKENAWPLRKAEAATGTAKNSAAPAEERHLTAAQKIAVATAKTRAMRRAMSVDSRAAICVAICGLLGTADIWISNPSGPNHDIHGSLLMETVSIEVLLKPALEAANLKPDDTRYRFDTAHAARLYTALYELLDTEQLTELFCRLTAERIGARTGYDTALGDNPLTIAIAHSVKAALLLPDTWTVTRDYFAAYGRDRLFALCLAHGIQGANKMKKGEMVDALWNFGADYWTRDRFHELEFLSAGALKKRLSGPEKPGVALQAGEAA
jgi:hypothetical protein